MPVPVVVPGIRLDGTDPGVEFDADLVSRFGPGERIGGRFPIEPNGFSLPAIRIPAGEAGVRVACLGDSCTFGIGAGPRGSYAWVLSEALALAFGPDRADVLNAGRPGYSSAQSLAWLRRDVLPLRPSVVVAYLGANNDFVRVSRLTDHDVLDRLGRLPIRLVSSSHLARFLLDLLSRTRGEWQPSPDHVERVPLPRFESNLEEVARLCRDAGAEPVFVVPPFAPEKRAAIPVCLEYAEAVRRAAARLDVPLLDVSEEFGAFDAYSSFLFAEPIHPNANGHRILAARLYDLLVTDPRLARAFDRAGPEFATRRAFEALAARSEREAVSEPDLPHVLALLGEHREDPLSQALGLLEAKDLAGAAARLAEAAVLHPYRPGIRRLLALLEGLRGNRAGEAAALEQWAAIRSHVVEMDPIEAALQGIPPVEAPEHLSLPVIARAAVLLLHRDRVLGEGPRFDRRIPRAFALAAQGRLEEGTALLEGALETNPREPVALRLLAERRLGEGKVDLAESLFERAARARPDDWQSRLTLARLLRDRGDTARAVEHLEAILREFPMIESARAMLRELAPERFPR